jgi:hypothetical protein
MGHSSDQKGWWEDYEPTGIWLTTAHVSQDASCQITKEPASDAAEAVQLLIVLDPCRSAQEAGR